MSIINIYTGLCARHYSKYQCVYTHTHIHTHSILPANLSVNYLHFTDEETEADKG